MKRIMGLCPCPLGEQGMLGLLDGVFSGRAAVGQISLNYYGLRALSIVTHLSLFLSAPFYYALCLFFLFTSNSLSIYLSCPVIRVYLFTSVSLSFSLHLLLSLCLSLTHTHT